MCWFFKGSCKVSPSVDVVVSPKTAWDDKTVPQPLGEKMPDVINTIASTMVTNNFLSTTEAQTQVNAINAFYEGKMSYAEMRLLAG